MAGSCEIVIVGGGIGGAALARALASEGIDVTVLEATTVFEDRVRGESMQPWGVKEARDLGVEVALLDAGAHVAGVWRGYSSWSDEPSEVPVSIAVPDVGGTLNLRHPIACQTLLESAESAGARVVRGVKDVRLTGGSNPHLTYDLDGECIELTAALVVGADGRASTIRRQSGIELHHQNPVSHIAGLLVEGLEGVPDDYDAMATDEDKLLVLFHQGNGRARVYLCPGLSGQHRFAGASGTERFLEACATSSYPWGDAIASATPAGPCATYPGDDTWTAEPFAPGVVLIGDAAGHNDPVIGQGLSIALRDARIVRDLILDGARSPAAFAPYGTERMGRMERLRLMADVVAVTNAEDADNRAARLAGVKERIGAMDPEVFPILWAVYAGPETIGPELLGPGLLDRIRAA